MQCDAMELMFDSLYTSCGCNQDLQLDSHTI